MRSGDDLEEAFIGHAGEAIAHCQAEKGSNC